MELNTICNCIFVLGILSTHSSVVFSHVRLWHFLRVFFNRCFGSVADDADAVCDEPTRPLLGSGCIAGERFLSLFFPRFHSFVVVFDVFDFQAPAPQLSASLKVGGFAIAIRVPCDDL